jgi:hypothetical protein
MELTDISFCESGRRALQKLLEPFQFERQSIERPRRSLAQLKLELADASPTWQPLQLEATGAVMEVTKWLKPSVWLVTYR